jgi:hypothetical protein
VFDSVKFVVRVLRTWVFANANDAGAIVALAAYPVPDSATAGSAPAVVVTFIAPV